MSVSVFFSYAHEDEKLRDDLAKQLKLLERQGVISAWHDRQIIAGSEWGSAIDTHLDSAQVILLLISPDFLASDYCWDIEVKRAMERHEAGEARVIPVILRPVDYWQEVSFGKLQALPTNAKPVTTWENRDEAFRIVAQGIRQVVKELKTKKPFTLYPSPTTPKPSPDGKHLSAIFCPNCKDKPAYFGLQVFLGLAKQLWENALLIKPGRVTNRFNGFIWKFWRGKAQILPPLPLIC